MASIDLVKLGIIKSASGNSSSQGFEKILDGISLENYRSNNLTASGFIAESWEKLTGDQTLENGVRGKYFEYLVAVTLYLEGVAPFYTYANLPLVPNVEFDLIMYSEGKGPIALSIKTSLRERYKQADLEALALKTVFRRAESYLITLNEKESITQQRKLEAGDLYALDKIVLATSKDFDQLVADLKTVELVKSPTFAFVCNAEREVPFHGKAN